MPEVLEVLDRSSAENEGFLLGFEEQIGACVGSLETDASQGGIYEFADVLAVGLEDVPFKAI